MPSRLKADEEHSDVHTYSAGCRMMRNGVNIVLHIWRRNSSYIYIYINLFHVIFHVRAACRRNICRPKGQLL
jgi:hypothetical protein